MTNSAAVAVGFHTTSSAVKKQKRRQFRRQNAALLPGLPDHVAHLCLDPVPPATLFAVCHSWRRLIYSADFPPFPSLYTLFLSAGTLPEIANSIQFASFDPISRRWTQLPDPPAEEPPLRLLYRHPSFISRKLPIQSVAVDGKLVVLAASTDRFLPALSRPLIFDPSSRRWSHGPRLAAPRRWCAAGALRRAVYVASGIGSHYENDVARSVVRWSLDRPGRRWETAARLRDAKFSREAIDAVGWRGKLCMVNVKGDAAKEGIVYDAEQDAWEEMPEGMLGGWRGPAAAMDEETIYAVDESRGSLRRYDPVKDAWVDVAESEALRGAQAVAAGGGRVCVLCGDGASVAVVDVAAEQAEARVWMVEAPAGVQAVGIHILPRLSPSEF